MKACKQCNYIFEEGDECPLCNSHETTEKFGGKIYVFDPEKSEIGNLLQVKAKGIYAVRVK